MCDYSLHTVKSRGGFCLDWQLQDPRSLPPAQGDCPQPLFILVAAPGRVATVRSERARGADWPCRS